MLLCFAALSTRCEADRVTLAVNTRTQAFERRARLGAIPGLDGQDLVPDALPHVALATSPDRRHRQQRQLPQVGP